MSGYKYQHQLEETWCGAACLSMVYEKYGISYSQGKIMGDLNKNKNDILMLADIVKHINIKPNYQLVLLKQKTPKSSLTM